MRNFWHKNQKLILTYVVPTVVGVLGLGGVAWLVFGSDAHAQRDASGQAVGASVAQEAGQGAAGSSVVASSGKTVPVYVAGGVTSPGVYWVSENALVGDVLALAGGYSSECDVKSAELALNLADKVVEGMKIYVPRVGDQVAGSEGQDIETTTSSKVSINKASKSDLMDLNGIGEAYSEKIIDGRPYKTLDDLTARGIIPNATYEKIKAFISL